MKFCSVCRQRYDDAQNFCLNDGATLEVFSSESQVPTAHYADLNDLTVKPTEASPTIFSPPPGPPTSLPQKEERLTDLFPNIKSPHSVSPSKSNPLLIALISIFATLGVVGLIGGGAWLWVCTGQASNQISSNPASNSNQNSPILSKSNARTDSNQNSRPDKKSSNTDTSNTTISSNRTETAPANLTPAPIENSAIDLQVKFTNLGKTQNYPVSGGSITIQIEGKTLTASTNNAGIAYFKSVSCDKSVRISVKSEDGSGTFNRQLKCGTNTAWSYQTDCFVAGKNGGCAIEQVK